MKKKPTYNGIEFDSGEEIEIYQWCEEAKSAGLIIDFIYQPPSYTLSEKQTYTVTKHLKTKIRYDEKTLLRPHIYTADFKILSYLSLSFLHCEHLELYGVFESIIDVKGSFSRHNDAKSFSINQKWLYDKHGVYVNKVVPDDFFKKTWIPDRARYTFKTRKLRKKFVDYPSIGDYLNGA